MNLTLILLLENGLFTHESFNNTNGTFRAARSSPDLFFAHELPEFSQTVFYGWVSVVAGGNPRNQGSDPEAAQPPLDSEALGRRSTVGLRRL